MDLPLSFAQLLTKISIKDNLLIKGNRIIIPKSFEAKNLEQMRSRYQALYMYKKHARRAV